MRPSIFGLLGNRVPARLCPFRASWAVRTVAVRSGRYANTPFFSQLSNFGVDTLAV